MSPSTATNQVRPMAISRWLWLVLPLGWLWWVLINHLRVEWSLNAQYSYGWFVPFLCGLLIWKRLQNPEGGGSKKSSRDQVSGSRFQGSGFRFQVLAWLLAVLYLPTRLVEVANPDWRLVSWTMALEVVGLTLLLLRISNFKFQISVFSFPLLFFLVSVPWPTALENLVIQSLTRLDVVATTEIMGWFGVPAFPQGNVIEVATGLVGIDEACSGIRSFQATLMISLFFGEWLRLKLGRRAILVLSGFLFSLLFNLGRLLVMVGVASQKGIAAASRWHDPAGVAILLGCFCGVWLLSHGLARKKTESRKQKVETDSQFSVFSFQFSVWPLVALGIWILLVETGVEGWYRWHESRLPSAVTWHVAWPDNPTLREEAIAPETRRILRYDDGRHCNWQDGDLGWQVIFLRWNPGSVAARLTVNHTPEVCLPAAGHRVVEQTGIQVLTVHELPMPFRLYELNDKPQPVFVAYCLWEDRAATRQFATGMLNWHNRFAPALAGERNAGQRSIEIAITGAADLAAAKDALQQLLEKIIVPGG